MNALVSNFSPIDWILVIIYLSVTLLVGVFANRYVRSMADYMVAGRSLRSYLGVATLVGSELGLVTVMYAAQKGFTGGFAAFHIGLIAGVVALLVGLTGFIVVPLRAMEVKTIPEFYEKRFGTGVRILGGLILAIAGILNMGMFLKAGAIFVTALTGMQDPSAVNWVMTGLILLVLCYTILGGMVSVVITDYIQFVVLSVGLLVACALAVAEVGWNNTFDTVAEIHGEAGFDPFSEDGFGMSYVVWMCYAGLVSCAVWQTAVMRACAAESTAVVKRLFMWSSIGFMIRFMVPQFLGICALVYFWQHDTARGMFFEADGKILADSTITLQAMPVFLSQILPVGVIGLIGAGMLAAFMSTHDSYLLCWASVLAEDVIHPTTGKRLPVAARLLIARILILLIGAFLLVWSLWYPLNEDLWDYMVVTGAVYSIGAFALLLAGIYWRRASRAGAYAALVAGSSATLGLGPVREALEIPMRFTASNIGLSATVLALVLMVVVSLLFPDRERK